MALIQSWLITGASGVGKSTLARSAIVAEGSGFVLACPGSDELDSYYGLDNVLLHGVSDFGDGEGWKELVSFLKQRFTEVRQDKLDGKEPRYKVAVFDTISGAGQFAASYTLKKFGRDSAPPALSPDGAAFYSFLRARQEEVCNYFRALKGYGVHIIALSHIGESDISSAQSADVPGGSTIKVYTPLVPGAFKTVLPSYFSTVLHANVGKDKAGNRVHYVGWKADGKKMAKSRLGLLSSEPFITLPAEENGWKIIKDLVEKAANNRLGMSQASTKEEEGNG